MKTRLSRFIGLARGNVLVFTTGWMGILTLCFVLFPVNKSLADFDAGVTAVKSGNFVGAFAEFKRSATNGNRDAQVLLGFMYLGLIEGGLLIDEKKAAEWFRKAAEQGQAEAQYQLGLIYYTGNKSIKRNKTQAFSWFKKAAEQGYPAAENSVGNHYYLGEATKRDYDQAAVWYTKGAMQGDDFAQRNLGALYDNGQGVTKDFVEGYVWFVLSARQGNELARQWKESKEPFLSYAEKSKANKRADQLSKEISRKNAEQPKTQVQILKDFIFSCIPVPGSAQKSALTLNGFAIDNKKGDSWCYSGSKDHVGDPAVITTVKDEGKGYDDYYAFKFVVVTDLDNLSFNSSKELYRYAKKNKLIRKVMRDRVGKVKYVKNKSDDAVCVNYKWSYKGDITKGAYANGHGQQCIHPDAPDILISAELVHGTPKRPSEQERNRLKADANAFFNTISFAPLNL